MKKYTKHHNKSIVYGVSIALVILILIIWLVRAHSNTVVNNLKSTPIFVAVPAPQSILLAEGSDRGFSNNEVTQNPSVVKVYAVSGDDVGTLIAHYEQTYPSYSYRWQVDYYFPSPGVSGANLIGEQGAKTVAVYIGPAPYKPQYPAISVKQAPSNYRTYVTILVSEKK